MESLNVYEKPVTLKNILKFAVPTIAMTVFMSFYTMVGRAFGHQSDGAYHPACHGCLYHARHRRQRSHYEKDGGTKMRGSEGGFYFPDLSKCYGRDRHVCGGVSGNEPHFCRYESFRRCGRVLCGIFKPVSGVYRADSSDE